MTKAFEAIDQVAESATSVAKEPAFSDEVHRRLEREPMLPVSDDIILRELATLIAFSENARSDLVEQMIERGDLQSAFEGFDVSQVAALDPAVVVEQHWEQIRCIRFKKKVARIIYAAESLKRLRKEAFVLRDRLTDNAFPIRIRRPEDIERFWTSFDHLRERFRGVAMPYFGQLTSLLHMLLHFGFDCIKPDLIVQNVAREGGLLPSRPRERDLRQLVVTIQEYSLSRGIRPGVVDFYLLVYGGQTWAKQFSRAEAPRITRGLPVVAPDPKGFWRP